MGQHTSFIGCIRSAVSAGALNRRIWRLVACLGFVLAVPSAWAQGCPAGRTCFPATSGALGPGAYVYTGPDEAVADGLLFSSTGAVCASRTSTTPTRKTLCTGGAGKDYCECQTYDLRDDQWIDGGKVTLIETPFAWCPYRSDGYKQPGYSYGAWGLWCTSNGDRPSIRLIGASATKALPSGPALPQKAIVTLNGALVPNKFVTVNIGTQVQIMGFTDANGEFPFTYVPPAAAPKS